MGTWQEPTLVRFGKQRHLGMNESIPNRRT